MYLMSLWIFRYSVWPDDRFCEAFKTDVLRIGEYTIDVEFWFESGIHDYVGIIFNYWDELNYEYALIT